MARSSIARLGLWLGMLLVAGAVPLMAQPEVPALTGRVVDLGDILSPQTESLITTLLAAHEDSTSNQVAVLTIPSLNGEVLEDYSIRVAETWALGTAENDNGVLLLVAVADRELRIEVGLGLEGTLTDVTADRIIRNEIVPHFRAGDYDSGVLVGVQSIIAAIEGTYEPSETASDEAPPFWAGLLFLLIPTVFAVVGLFSPGCVRWFLFLFLIPFYFASGLILTNNEGGAIAVVVVYMIAFIGAHFIPAVKGVHKKYKGFWAMGTGGGSSGSSSWSSSSSSSWSSSSSSWSSGSSFSGGGGSFGGGGSSGSW